jgi:hypothetical protein
MRAHDPVRWFARDARAGLRGVIVAGGNDHNAQEAQATLAAAARRAHLPLLTYIIPGGGHDFPTWGHALQITFPWIVRVLDHIPRRLPPVETVGRRAHAARTARRRTARRHAPLASSSAERRPL